MAAAACISCFLERFSGFCDHAKAGAATRQPRTTESIRVKTSYGNRILDIKWDMHRKLYFDATIRISGIDRLGMLNEITQVISSQMNVNIHKILITCEEGIFEGTIEMRVHSSHPDLCSAGS